jgi:type IV pilus assembly protein PilA
MKSDLKVKFLSHLARKKKGEGFTLIELLVVVIIIGILAAIALPSFLNQANKARQSEGKQNVGAIVRAQQAYFLDKGNEFATDIKTLGVGLSAKTDNYQYKMTADNATAEANKVTITTAPQRNNLKAYSGGVYVLNSGTATDVQLTTQSILCESQKAVAKTTDSTAPTDQDNCAGGYNSLSAPTVPGA